LITQMQQVLAHAAIHLTNKALKRP